MTTAQISRMTTADISVGVRSLGTSPENMLSTQANELFPSLIESYSAFALNTALRILGNFHDAEDAVQEAFLSAYRAFPRFRGQSKVSTWLYRIVVNACLLKMRREASRGGQYAHAEYDDGMVDDWSQNPERAAVNGELRDVIKKGLNSLAMDLRKAIVLRDVQGFSNEDAAESLGITVAALKSRLHRGRVQLRSWLEERDAKPDFRTKL